MSARDDVLAGLRKVREQLRAAPVHLWVDDVRVEAEHRQGVAGVEDDQVVQDAVLSDPQYTAALDVLRKVEALDAAVWDLLDSFPAADK